MRGSSSRPLSFPISRSESMRSGARSRILARASAKVGAARTRWPARSRKKVISSRIRGSFSTRRRSAMVARSRSLSRPVPPRDLVERHLEEHRSEDQAHLATRAVDLPDRAALPVPRQVDPAPLLHAREEGLATLRERRARDLRLQDDERGVDPLALLRRELVEQRASAFEGGARGAHAFLDTALRLGLEQLAAARDRGALFVDLAAHLR